MMGRRITLELKAIGYSLKRGDIYLFPLLPKDLKIGSDIGPRSLDQTLRYRISIGPKTKAFDIENGRTSDQNKPPQVKSKYFTHSWFLAIKSIIGL